MGSPLWRRLVLCALTAASSLVVALLPVAAPDSTVARGIAFAWGGVGALAIVTGGMLLMLARTRDERPLSPGWYREMQRAARAQRAASL